MKNLPMKKLEKFTRPRCRKCETPAWIEFDGTKLILRCGACDIEEVIEVEGRAKL